MKVRALHWVNYNGIWHKAGEEFIVSKEGYDGIAKCVELIAETGQPDVDNVEEPAEDQKTEPVKRGRKRKAETEND